MQTFLPYSDFAKSAKCLDNRRLNKQIVEVQQIYKALSDSSYGWQSHPAVNMWRGHTNALISYGLVCYDEWKYRKDQQGLYSAIHQSGEFLMNLWYVLLFCDSQMPLPNWIGDEQFHASHRSNLLRKDFEHYSKFGWTEPTDLPYIWPV
jgi:hypothetical protein